MRRRFIYSKVHSWCYGVWKEGQDNGGVVAVIDRLLDSQRLVVFSVYTFLLTGRQNLFSAEYDHVAINIARVL